MDHHADHDHSHDAAPVTYDGRWPASRGGGMAWSSMAFPTGNASTSALGVEKGYPREVRLNQPFEYQIVVTNLTSTTLENVMVTDEPNGNMQLMESNPRGRIAASGLPTWEVGNMAPGETQTIRVSARATQEGTVGTCATVSYNSSLCSTVPVVAPKLALTKAAPAQVMACDPIVYNFEVTNTGTGTIDDVVITDELPAGLVGPNGQRTLTFNVGSLAAGQSAQRSATVTAERTGRFQNDASAAGGGLEVDSNSVSTVVVKPELTISKTCTERQFIGRPITYEITVTNTGDGDARNTVVTDTIPAGLQMMNASDGGRAQGGNIVWNVGTLAPNQSKTVTAQLMSPAAGTFRNTASANADCADVVTDGCQTLVTGIPAILLEVIDVEDPIQVGSQVTYVITVTNQGSAPDTNVQIVANLEANQSHVSSGGATNSNVTGRTITFAPIPSLAPKERAEFRIVVRADAAGDTRFKVTMTSDELNRPVEETEATNLYE
ncbi:MAG: hypothetical protein AAF432_05740 [Planctomycetota bacterium]